MGLRGGPQASSISPGRVRNAHYCAPLSRLSQKILGWAPQSVLHHAPSGGVEVSSTVRTARVGHCAPLSSLSIRPSWAWNGSINVLVPLTPRMWLWCLRIHMCTRQLFLIPNWLLHLGAVQCCWTLWGSGLTKTLYLMGCWKGDFQE